MRLSIKKQNYKFLKQVIDIFFYVYELHKSHVRCVQLMGYCVRKTARRCKLSRRTVRKILYLYFYCVEDPGRAMENLLSC